MFTEETAAVIVSYNPDMDVFGQLLTSLSTQCPAVVIDNGSSQDCIQSLKELAGNYAHVELLCSGDNMGIAHAQNTAANHILKTNTHVRYILMLDHDSIPDENMVGVLMDTFESLVDKKASQPCKTGLVMRGLLLTIVFARHANRNA